MPSFINRVTRQRFVTKILNIFNVSKCELYTGLGGISQKYMTIKTSENYLRIEKRIKPFENRLINWERNTQ